MRFVVVILIALTLNSCDWAASPKTSDGQPTAKSKALPAAERDRLKFEPSELETAAVREVLLRHQFKRKSSGTLQKAKALFIRIDDKDPDDVFLKRFNGHAPPVRLGSQFRDGEGLLFHVEAFKWIDSNTVEASGGCYEGNLGSSGHSYRLERKNGAWHVTIDEMNWVS